ncbi:MAG TPA: hypothetical protein VHL59_06875 [Thermoanaerobaculia bacterium]|nr:hypothetical protein [Thermoanaerobaculia bacterium]
MRKWVFIAAAAAVLLGCQGSNSPTGVAKQFYESLNSSNPAWACEHFQPCGSMTFYANDMDRVANTVLGKISDIRVEESSASEVTADVTVRLKLDGVEKSGVVKMIKHNEIWKVRDGSGFRVLGIDFWGM